MNGIILVVDDENGIRWALKHKLSKGGHQVITAENGEEALAKLDANPDVALVDVRMPGMDGFSFIREARRIKPQLSCIAMTGCGTVGTASRARKVGAAHFIEKPFRLAELEGTIQKLLKDRPGCTDSLPAQFGELPEGGRTSDGAILGRSPKMKEVFSVIRRLQKSSTSTVLITGESGTGKELVARAVHYTSSRRDQRFTEVNCAALTEPLLEAELFGYEKGAFTGAATTGKVGLFEATDGGTIFLDEIGEMGLNLQAKLLRVLQERKFRKVGGVETIEVDVRVIASTNCDLRRLVRHAGFRVDLYYRLNVVPVHVPPLRSRREDILLIANYYLRKFNREFGTQIVEFAPEVEEKLKAYHWPGNVRELRNVIERAVLMETGDHITGRFLMFGDDQPVAEAPAESLPMTDRSLASMEKQLISRVLSETRWQRSEAAKILGIHRTTLAAKIKEYGLDSGRVRNTTN
jgi:two-component system response regulator AtoC